MNYDDLSSDYTDFGWDRDMPVTKELTTEEQQTIMENEGAPPQPDPPTLQDLVVKALLRDEHWNYRSLEAITRLINEDFGRVVSQHDVHAALGDMRLFNKVFLSESGEGWGHSSKVMLPSKILDILLSHLGWDWRSVDAVAKDLDKPSALIEYTLAELLKLGKVRRNPNNTDLWGNTERVGMEMSKEERIPGEQELWDKSHPVVLDPVTFAPIPVVNLDRSVVSSDFEVFPVCESAQQGFVPDEGVAAPDEGVTGMLPQHRRQHQAHMRGLIMNIDRLPTNLIVKAISDALAHAREVGQREHIKADRIERVNQFIVSLRRQFGYMGDSYRTEREFLSAQLARKEVWYDVGVINPHSITGLNTSTSLKPRDVENWLAQAEAMTPSYGDLKSEIEKDLERLKGSILVAETCNKTTGELNRNADKVLEGMAALAADM